LLSKLIDKESPFRCSNELAANKLATIKTTKRLFQGQLNITCIKIAKTCFPIFKPMAVKENSSVNSL
ncbi:MAG: hypothetical protein LBC74_05715, partial [Planctomycetaceae bacterium]|nr:hypothetical protein [Planctomycetaceae bacterium]